MRPVGHIQPRRSAFDAAQHEMAHGIEADGVPSQRIFDGMSYFIERKGLQQAQHLDVLARPVFLEPRLQQPAQLSEAGR